jgi:hypothetical protein
MTRINRNTSLSDEVVEGVEQLRRHYDHLSKKKREISQRRMNNITPTKRQIHLFEEGTRKLQMERCKQEESENRDNINASSSRNPSPIPICDRLYEEGMHKVFAEKMALEKKREHTRRQGSSRSRNPSPIPICNRLYEQGMHKKMAEKLADTNKETGTKSSLGTSQNRRRYSISPIPICDRLYEQGMMTKLKTSGKERLRLNDSSDSSRPPLRSPQGSVADSRSSIGD